MISSLKIKVQHYAGHVNQCSSSNWMRSAARLPLRLDGGALGVTNKQVQGKREEAEKDVKLIIEFERSCLRGLRTFAALPRPV